MVKLRILVAGIGNIFLGDDGFGVEVVSRLARRRLPEEVRVVDFGIRGLDLAYALMERFELAILVDATELGNQPGTLYVIEPSLDDSANAAQSFEAHGMNPAAVLCMIRSMGGTAPPLRLVGCEPETLGSEEAPALGLSEIVQARVEEAVRMVEEMIAGALACTN